MDSLSSRIDPDKVPAEAAEALAFYKAQIQELESELADFQASSRELEQELEKELEASEKRHRDLRNKNEELRYEVDEWKSKYKNAKNEANSAQNGLQKEVTALRDTNRTLQLRLRDIEVSNDEFEHQDRINQSSLEDLEQKYNQAIERGVMQDEEIRTCESERETLRIELQRLKEELADLKIEQEVTEEKLSNALHIAKGSLAHVPPPMSFHRHGAPSSLSETSSVLSSSPRTPTTSIATTSTPQSDHSSPPSPPISEVSTPSRSSQFSDPATTPRPSHFHQKPDGSQYPPLRRTSIRKTRGHSNSVSNTALPLPSSKSLHQIRGLIGQMQRLEQRVQNARSKLPGPAITPPRANGASTPLIPASAQRSQRKSRPGSTVSNSSVSTGTGGGRETPSRPGPGGHRMSFSATDREIRPLSRAGPDSRPPSRMNDFGFPVSNLPTRPESRTATRSSMGGGIPRPASRAGGDLRMSALPPPPPIPAIPTTIPRMAVDPVERGNTPVKRRNTIGRLSGAAVVPGVNTGIPVPGAFSAARKSVSGYGKRAHERRTSEARG